MIVVTGATGKLGRLVVNALLERGAEVVAAVRDPGRARDLADRGVEVREADYDRPGTLGPAFDGAGQVLLISGSEVGRRVPQHWAAVDAAKTAGVRLLAYTSVLHADTSTAVVAPEHRATEEYVRASGVPFAFLRNGWYNENYEAVVRESLTTGVIPGAAHDGRVASAARADYAEAAAVVLTGEGHEGAVHELSGDVAWTMAELAALVTEVSGTEVVYHDMEAVQYARTLVGGGVPEVVARTVARMDTDIAEGLLADVTGELARLIGRPTTPMRETVLAAVKR
ncbi:SDR family oxidoreductase [Saccharothrix syringae]|uniref:SDR family oxidoreductase n=1 Tax=Saccharothrix syringae TaxID=103733 RepID=A0A5Q0H8G6_SACSY|nr:SDR family oxidoreductase [Saccharothrix syringae]QFZ22130.1 SDR family oxidoreductase [Saccharothrix syringae]